MRLRVINRISYESEVKEKPPLTPIQKCWVKREVGSCEECCRNRRCEKQYLFDKTGKIKPVSDREEAAKMYDDGVDALVGAIIKSALEDATMNVEKVAKAMRVKNRIDRASKKRMLYYHQTTGRKFFRLEGTLFTVTKLSAEYLFKHYKDIRRKKRNP